MNKVAKISLVTASFVIVSVAAYAFLVLHLTWPIEVYSIEKAGMFGDSFGFLTSVFSGLAFAGVIWTVLSQREELDITRRELKVQGFDNAYFQMLRLHNQIVDGIGVALAIKGRNTFVHFKQYLEDTYNRLKTDNSDTSESELLAVAYDQYWEKNQCHLGHYFRVLYNILRFLKERDVKKDDYHAKLLRAQLSDQELYVIFYNCLYKHGNNFVAYAVEYQLFDNLGAEYLLSKDHKNLIDRRAFGEKP